MKEIPLKAKVQCTDGPCVESTNVVLSRDTLQVTHVAIKDKKLPGNPTRLVPIEKVADALHDHISLNCTKDEVAKMDPFTVTQMVQESGSGTAYRSGDAYGSQYVVNDTAYDSVQAHQIPAGAMAVTPGMKISASDHRVGKLDEFLLDPKSGAITHLLMQEGYLWGKKDVAIPVEDVDFTDGETIYLTIDKDAVAALPAVSNKRS